MIEEKEHQWHDGFPTLPRGMTVLPWLLWATIICGVIGALWAGKVFAEPVFQASGDGITFVLYDEPCRLTEQVANLPSRATKLVHGETIEGCVGIKADQGVVVFFFADKRVVYVPLQAFRPVTNA